MKENRTMAAVKFKRTMSAAEQDRLGRWELISAIAEDAVEADLPIVSQDSILAAFDACAAAGDELAQGTVKDLCVVAKFDHESTAKQRRLWRSYGWSIVGKAAKAGWSQESAAEFLGEERRKHADVVEAISCSRRSAPPGTGGSDWDAEVLANCDRILAALDAEAKGETVLAHSTYMKMHYTARAMTEAVAKNGDLTELGQQTADEAAAYLQSQS